MAQQGTINVSSQDDDDDEDEEDESGRTFGLYGMRRRPRRHRRGTQPELPPVPNPEGTKLMESGTFGQSTSFQDRLRKRKRRVSRMLMERELGLNADQARRKNKETSQVITPSAATILCG